MDASAMQPLTIRRAVLEDAPALALVGAATFLESYFHMIPGPDLMLHCQVQHSEVAYRDYLGAPRSACWLVEHAETAAPVGYATLCPPDLPVPTGPTDLELKRIYLFSTCQGRGVATDLLGQVEEFARGHDCQRLLLGTYEGNSRAIRFYEREGFRVCGTRRFTVGHRQFDDVVMDKLL